MKRKAGSINWFRAGGFALVIVGVAWLITDLLLRNYYPLLWGGPNFGGGLLAIVSVLAVVAGLVLIAVEIPLDWRGGRRRLSVMSWIAVGVSALLAITYVGLAIVQPGDPSAGVNGQVGVMVSASGSPVLILQVCRGSVDHLGIVGPNRGAVPNEKLAEFKTDHPVGVGALSFDLQNPPDGWTLQPGSSLATAYHAKPKIAFGIGRHSELRQVGFSDADLKSLPSGTVLYSTLPGRNHMALADFAAYACR